MPAASDPTTADEPEVLPTIPVDSASDPIEPPPVRGRFESDGRFAAGVGTQARCDDLSRRCDGLWNQLLGEDLALRVVASRNERPGDVRDLRSGQDDINSSDATQLRGLLSWRATDEIELRLSALRRKKNQDDGSFANNDQRPEHSQRYVPDTLSSTTDNLLLAAE